MSPAFAAAADAQTPPDGERHAVSSHPRPRTRMPLVRTNAPNAIPASTVPMIDV
mgnify:CR=1 FL=1